MRYYLIVAFCVLGCGDPWSPVGTYEIIKVWGGGNCFLTAPRRIVFSIQPTDPDRGYEVTIDNSDAETDVTILQSDDDCSLSIKMTESPRTGIPSLGDKVFTFTFVDTNGDLEGAGMLVIGAPDDCTQLFTVEGSKE